MVDHVVTARPRTVLDVATGTGGVAIQITRRCGASVVGLDLTEAMLREAERRIEAAGVERSVALVAGRAETLPFADDTFDALTFTYLLRYVAEPAETLKELARVVKPNSPVASLEFYVPTARPWRWLWWLYTRAVLPSVGSLWGRAWFGVGRFLGPDIEEHYRRHPLVATLQAWEDAGFVDTGFAVMSLGGGVVMWGRKRG